MHLKIGLLTDNFFRSLWCAFFSHFSLEKLLVGEVKGLSQCDADIKLKVLSFAGLFADTLRVLYMGDNDFEYIPPEIGRLKNLQIVSIHTHIMYTQHTYYAFTYAHTHTHTSAYTHAHRHTHTHTCMHAHMHVCTHTHTHTYASIGSHTHTPWQNVRVHLLLGEVMQGRQLLQK